MIGEGDSWCFVVYKKIKSISLTKNKTHTKQGRIKKHQSNKKHKKTKKNPVFFTFLDLNECVPILHTIFFCV